MMKALGLRSAGNVHATIGQLEDRGYVRRAHPRRARSLEVLRLTDDVSEGWLRAASTGAMVRELIRRGIGADTRSGHDRPDRLASDTPPDRRSRHGPGRTDGQAP
jgi:SOS-response transcriptional repressor LexA